MGLPEVLTNFRMRPGMYITSVTYDVAVAFVQGYDAATGGGLLTGLREWLIVALGDGNNLAWPGLIRMLAGRQPASKAPCDDKALIEFLLSTLDSFLREREERIGLRRIHVRYEAWLCQQEWYSPSSPDWIRPE